MNLDVPKLEKPQTHKSVIEDSYNSMKKTSSQKVDKIIDQMLQHIQDVLEFEYYEQEFVETLSLFDKKMLDVNLNTLLKDYKIDVRIVSTKNGCRVELSQKQTTSSSTNPLASMFQTLGNM